MAAVDPIEHDHAYELDNGGRCIYCDRLPGERFQVREMSGPQWDWIREDWCVVDTNRQARVGVYEDEESARKDCAERNKETDR